MARRQFLLALGSLLPLLFASPNADAQAFPNRPIHFVIPYAAGGGTDLLIRSIQEPLAKSLGQPIIVDNKSGAAGAIAAMDVAHAAPDGYTLLVSNNGPSAIVPLLQPDAKYDPIKDFTPVTTIARTPIVVIANPSVPATDMASFIAWAKRQPNGVSYGSAGVGSLGHLSAELFAKMSGVKLTHVPYRGQAPTMMAVLTGETPVAFTSSSDALFAQMKEGKIRLLGIGSIAPTPLVPGGVPIAKTLPGYEIDVWQGVLAPANTPPAVVAKLNQAINAALAMPDIQKKFASISYMASGDTPKQFADMLASEVDHWKAVIRERDIHVDR